jgi:hypothetical protein
LNLFRPGQGFYVVINLQLMDLKYMGSLFAIVIPVRCIDSSARSRKEVKISSRFNQHTSEGRSPKFFSSKPSPVSGGALILPPVCEAT